MRLKRSRFLYSLLVLAILYLLFNAQDWLVRFPAYRHYLYRGHPFYVPEGIKTSLQIVLCLLAMAVSLGRNFGRTCDELGLDRGFRTGLLFGFLATTPFFIGLAITHHLGKPAWLNIFYLAFFASFAEELVVRACGFGRLYRRCRWSAWLAMLLTAASFGWGHVEQGGNFREAVALFCCWAAGAPSSPGFITAGILSGSPWTVHALMNFYWELFSVSKTALGGWFPFFLQWITILCAALLTWKVTRKQSAAQVSV